MADRVVELLAIGAGPSNLGLAIALEELAPDLAADSLLIERDEATVWQRGMLMPWAQSQVSFLKDLVILRNPRSRYSFINYLHSMGRLDDFINLSSFTPYRREISDYLRWVAESLQTVRVEYGRRSVGIEPCRDEAGTLTGWRTRLADGSTIRSKVLVMGIGRDANIPPEFAALPAERIVHSTEYVQRINELAAKAPDERPHRVVVLGGAQSSAEMLYSVMRDLPGCRPTLIMRSMGFSAYQTSKFTNELYYPSFVNDFYHALPSAQEQMLREMHNTNYAGLSPSLLEELYRTIYLERLGGEQRTQIKLMTDVTGSHMDGDEIVLELSNRRTGYVEEVRCDLVLLGTGFVRQMPLAVRRLAADLGLPRVEVTRSYRLVIEEPATALCYLQGVNEATHGIADSLLSVIAARSADIVADIQAQQAHTSPELAVPELRAVTASPSLSPA
jgi:L-ornithine N5-oxygenase